MFVPKKRLAVTLDDLVYKILLIFLLGNIFQMINMVLLDLGLKIDQWVYLVVTLLDHLLGDYFQLLGLSLVANSPAFIDIFVSLLDLLSFEDDLLVRILLVIVDRLI